MQNKLTELVKKYREPIAYLFFGGLATLLNIVLYVLFKTLFGYEAANSWGNVADNVICILFAYFTNRIWVFRSKAHGSAALRDHVCGRQPGWPRPGACGVSGAVGRWRKNIFQRDRGGAELCVQQAAHLQEKVRGQNPPLWWKSRPGCGILKTS